MSLLLFVSYCRSGIGKHIEYKNDVSLAELVSHRKVKNQKLIASQKEDTQFSQHLMQACREDAALGRMDQPQLVGPHHMDVGSATFSPRFGVEQGRIALNITLALGCGLFVPPSFVFLPGVKADGTRKVRPIDDMTRWAPRFVCDLPPPRHVLGRFVCTAGLAATLPRRQARNSNMRPWTFCRRRCGRQR